MQGGVRKRGNKWSYYFDIGTVDGKRKKKEKGARGETLRMVLRALFVPPVSLAVWFAILSFCVMCYLTAFGFD